MYSQFVTTNIVFAGSPVRGTSYEKNLTGEFDEARKYFTRPFGPLGEMNLMPVIAANRIGREVGRGGEREINFYGSSFIADATGAKVAEAGRDTEAVLIASFDLAELQTMRHAWGLFRDRRPDLYQPLLTLDGGSPSSTGR